MAVSEAVVDVERLREIIVAEKERRLRAAREKRLADKSMVVAKMFGRMLPKSHGSYYVYPPGIVEKRDYYYTWDERRSELAIIYDDYGSNIDVFWKGEKVLDVHLGEIELYVPGDWEGVLEELYAEAIREKQRRRREQELRQLLEEARKWKIEVTG